MDVITTHLNADFDTIASMLAACKLYPGAVCVLPGSQEETVKGFLVQSAFYNLPMRKPREIDLDKVTRLILVDIRTRSRIGIFGELVGRPGVPVHVYDHHPDEDADVKGDLEVIRRVGSTTTILVQILKERGIPITPDEATVMMLGIYRTRVRSASRRPRWTTTSPRRTCSRAGRSSARCPTSWPRT